MLWFLWEDWTRCVVASDILLVFTKIALVVTWRMDLRRVAPGAGAPPGAHSHSQGRKGEGLTLASDLNWQRSGLRNIKMQTLGHVYIIQLKTYIDSGRHCCPHYTDEGNYYESDDVTCPRSHNY